MSGHSWVKRSYEWSDPRKGDLLKYEVKCHLIEGWILGK